MKVNSFFFKFAPQDPSFERKDGDLLGTGVNVAVRLKANLG
jgi:hypothetical protein